MKYTICLINCQSEFNLNFDLNNILLLLQDFQVEIINLGSLRELENLEPSLNKQKTIIISDFTKTQDLYNLVLGGYKAFVEIKNVNQDLKTALINLDNNLLFLSSNLMTSFIRFFQNSNNKNTIFDKLKNKIN